MAVRKFLTMPAGNEESDRTEPHEAFHLFGHRLRLEIVLALSEAEDFSLTFAELQSEVDERDSGKFSYHLSKLEGLFIEKVDDNYVLKHPGHRVIDASSGAFQDSPDIGPLEVAGTCPDCGGTPVFSYDDHIGTVACGSCGTKLVEYPIDPGAFYDRPADGGIDAFDRWVTATWRMASDGICFACAGQVDVSFTTTAEGPEYTDRYQNFFASDHPALLELDCQNCSFYSYIPASARLIDSPAVIRAVDKDVIDLRDSRIWELPFIIDGSHVDVLDTDPWEVLVHVPASDGSIEVRLDEDVSIAAVIERL